MLGLVRDIQLNKVTIECTEPVKFRIGQTVEVKEHRKNRSLSQNKLYWGFLSWCILREGGDLIDEGHWSTDALHLDIKSWIQATYPNKFNIKELFSSATLNTKEFTEFVEIVDRELMVQFFGIDTSRFWGMVNSGDVPF
jgi:hypothetical protein